METELQPLEDFSLAELDQDGALEEAAARAFPLSRGEFLRKGLLGGGALVAAVALPDPAGAGGALARNKRDIDMVTFDVVLEYLQSALYIEAQRLGALKPRTLDWARVVGAHELAHAEALKGMLAKAPARPTFNFRNITEREDAFIRTAVAFEDLTAALLKWQALRLESREILAAAATLHTVETRHAAWIRRIIGVNPSARSFDTAASQRKMAQLIARTGFVAETPRMTARGSGPRYTG